MLIFNLILLDTDTLVGNLSPQSVIPNESSLGKIGREISFLEKERERKHKDL